MNMNNIKGKVIVNDFGNGFVNANNITIYISKKNLNNAFNGELVEVEYYKDNELYNGRVINYSLINGSFSCGSTMTFEVFKILKLDVHFTSSNA